MRPATLVTETFLSVPRALTGGGLLLVGDEASVDGVGDVSFQRSECFLFGFAFGEFLVVVDPPRGWETDLGDGGHMDGMVQSPVPSQ